VSHLLELVEEADRNKDGNIDFSEWEIMGKSTLMKLLYCVLTPRDQLNGLRRKFLWRLLTSKKFVLESHFNSSLTGPL
jgi:EF hand